MDPIELEVDPAEEVVESSTPSETDVTPAPSESDPAPTETPPGDASAPPEPVEPELDADGNPVAAAFKPNTKMTILDKEIEIPKNLQKFMTDKESEKEIRDLFSKAGGVDFLKQKNAEITQKHTETVHQYAAMQNEVASLRGVYQTAVQTGNWHKMDAFFERLNIPQDHIMQYALEKAKLSEMPPEQRSVVEARLMADRRAETFASQQASTQAQNEAMMREMKQIQIESTMARPDVQALQNEFEARTSQPGSFRAMMQKYGNLAWHAERVNLSPQEVIDRMVKDFGLKGTAAPAPKPGAAAVQESSVPGKKVVQRTTNTIPNIQGKGGSSPLKNKPKSVDDLRELYRAKVQQDS